MPKNSCLWIREYIFYIRDTTTLLATVSKELTVAFYSGNPASAGATLLPVYLQ
jgi:hypothetical protein